MRKLNHKLKLLSFDIESSLSEVLTFEFFDANIPHTNIRTERFIHCISWKFHDEKEVHSVSVLDDKKRFKKNPHDDTHVLKVFSEVLKKSDAIIGHNSNSFDVKMVQGRLLLNGLPPLPNIQSYDTYRIAKKLFRLPSNKLDYLARVLKIGKKTSNSPDLWQRAFDGDEKALKEMESYCRNDVLILEKVFDRLMPHVKNNPLKRSEEAKCKNPACGSVQVRLKGTRMTKSGRNQEYCCNLCGSYGSYKFMLT